MAGGGGEGGQSYMYSIHPCIKSCLDSRQIKGGVLTLMIIIMIMKQMLQDQILLSMIKIPQPVLFERKQKAKRMWSNYQRGIRLFPFHLFHD